MKIIKATENRLEHSGIYIKDGDFAYKIEHAWAKWPDDIKGSDVLCPMCDDEDNLYVTTSHPDNPICVFDPNGNFVRSFGKGLFKRAHSIFFTKRGTILVADSSTDLHVVYEITKDGEVVHTFGTLGKPSDTGYDANAFEKAKENGILTEEQLRNPLIKLICWLDSIKCVGEPFNRPCFMVENAAGEFFAADGYGNAAMHKFATDRTYLKTWGGPGQNIGEFQVPHWLNIDKYDRIWLCDRENSRAYAYNSNGDVLALLDGGFWRIASSWSDDNYIYFTELGGGMFVVDIDKLEVVAAFGFKGCNIFACHGIGGDSKGNLYISSIQGARPIGNLFRLTRI